MASLFSQNIGTNYKGILNLNTLNGNLTTTLQAVTDGDGNSSPLQLSTTGVTINSALIVNNSVEGTTSGRMNIISQYDLAIQTGNSASGIGGLFVGGAGQAASARLHVKGDGTNPSFRSENSAATQGFIHSVVGDINNLFLGRFADTNVAGNIFYDNSSGLFTIRNNYAPAPNFGFIDLVHGNTTARIQNGTNLFALRDSNVAKFVSSVEGGGRHAKFTLNGVVTTSIYNGDGSSNIGWIGTESNHSFGILTNNNYRLIVSNAGNVSIGTTSESARLHVKGDGTNPIALFETTGAGSTLRIDNSQLRFGGSVAFGSLAYAMSGTTFSGNNNGTGLGFYSQFSIAGDSSRFDFGFGGDAVANTAGTVSHLALVRNFAAGAGSANYRPLNIAYTINNSGAQTGTATGIFLNATETALNGMGHNLMDLQVGGVSQFRVSKADSTIYATNYNISASVYLGNAIAVSNSGGVKVGDSRIRSDGDGNLTLLNDAANNFGLLKFGGALSTEPAIKKNGANLEFKNAADTGFCNISAGLTTANGFQSIAYNESFQRVGFNNGANFNILSYMRSSAAGVIILLDNSEANFNRLHFGGTAKPAVCQGSGTPEGAVTAPVGSIFMRSDGGVSSSLYVKQSGTGNTGWAAIA